MVANLLTIASECFEDLKLSLATLPWEEISWKCIRLAHRAGCGEPGLEKKRQVRGVDRNNLPRMSPPALPTTDTQCFQYMQDARLL